jgi:hypothetical protein
VLFRSADKYNIPVTTLKARLKLKSRKLRNGIDYRKLGNCNLIVFSPQGIQKIIK